MDGIVTREISAANTEGGALAGRDNLWTLAAYVWFLGPGFTFHLAGETPPTLPAVGRAPGLVVRRRRCR
jgi:hypothetical protein